MPSPKRSLHTAPLRSIGNQTDENLFRAQKIQIRVTARTRIDDGGKVLRESVSITSAVKDLKSKRDFQSGLGQTHKFALFPRLAVNRDFTAGNNFVQERLAIASKRRAERQHTWKKRDAFPIGYGHFVDSSCFSPRYDTKQVPPSGVGIGNQAAAVRELLWTRSAKVPFPNVEQRPAFLCNGNVYGFLIRAPY